MRSLLLIAVIVMIAGSPAVQAQILDQGAAALQDERVRNATIYSGLATVAPVAAGSLLYTSTDDATLQVLGLGLAGIGMVLGPSAGSFYLTDSRRGWIGVALRGAGTAAFAIGFGVAFVHTTTDDAAITLSSSLISLSAILVPYGFAYNFLNMGKSAESASLAVTPNLDRESGALMPALVVRF